MEVQRQPSLLRESFERLGHLAQKKLFGSGESIPTRYTFCRLNIYIFIQVGPEPGSSLLKVGMQVSIIPADTCGGTLQYCPELDGHPEGGTTGLAYVDKPVKPQHAPADCGFNVQYERVSITPSQRVLHPHAGIVS